MKEEEMEQRLALLLLLKRRKQLALQRNQKRKDWVRIYIEKPKVIAMVIYKLKQPCSLKLQVCLSMYDLLLPPSIKG